MVWVIAHLRLYNYLSLVSSCQVAFRMFLVGRVIGLFFRRVFYGFVLVGLKSPCQGVGRKWLILGSLLFSCLCRLGLRSRRIGLLKGRRGGFGQGFNLRKDFVTNFERFVLLRNNHLVLLLNMVGGAKLKH